MPRCKYSYYVTLLPCNQFLYGSTGAEFSQAPAPWSPLRTAFAHNHHAWPSVVPVSHSLQDNGWPSRPGSERSRTRLIGPGDLVKCANILFIGQAATSAVRMRACICIVKYLLAKLFAASQSVGPPCHFSNSNHTLST